MAPKSNRLRAHLNPDKKTIIHFSHSKTLNRTYFKTKPLNPNNQRKIKIQTKQIHKSQLYMVAFLGDNVHIPLTLTLSDTNFVWLGDDERDVCSLMANKSNNGNDLVSSIKEIWDLDQCFEPFITPNNIEMLFQYRLLDDFKIYVLSSLSLNLITPWSIYKEKFLVAAI